MEMITYKCPACGFVYLVPAYWSDYDAEPKMEMAHVNLQTKTDCVNKILEVFSDRS